MLLTALCVAVLCVSTTNGQCSDIIPGLNLMARGVDVTSLDLVPMDPVMHEDGFRGLLIKYTCLNKKTITLGNVKYNQPDQISVVSEIPQGSMDSRVSVIKTSSEARKSLSVNAGVDVDTPKVGFSASVTYEKMESTILQKNRKVESVSTAFGARRVDMVNMESLKSSLDTDVQTLLNKLPTSYTADPAAYRRFIKTFGTHYFVMAKFGGTLTMFLETTTDYYEKNSQTKIEAQAKATFAKALSVYGGTSTSTQDIDSKFTENSVQSVRYYGGSANLLDSKGISAWQPTISAQPWLFSSQLDPISDLIADPLRSSAMREAINDHVLRVYLTVELKRIINSLPSVQRASESATKLLAKIDTMNKKVPLVEEEVLAVGAEVNEAFIDLIQQYYSTLETVTGANKFTTELNFQCPAGQSITRILSSNSDYWKDREFSFQCSYLPKMKSLANCAWSADYVNPWEGGLNYKCPSNGVIKGWYAVHSDWFGDRRFQFLCCTVEGFTVNPTCAWSGEVNSFDGYMDYSITSSKSTISGVFSYHSKYYKDRVWEFYVCTYPV